MSSIRSENLSVPMTPNMKNRIHKISENNSISESGLIRMLIKKFFREFDKKEGDDVL